MSSAEAADANIPARITVKDLASALGSPQNEIVAVLEARGEPSAPEDYVAGSLAVQVASTLGFEIEVEARDLALECLYQYETTGEFDRDIPVRVARLVSGVTKDLDQLDNAIEGVSEHWSVARMPVIDRNILRLGLHELQQGETATAVVVSEGVRLAQTYSTEKSASFVNGLLARLAEEVRDR